MTLEEIKQALKKQLAIELDVHSQATYIERSTLSIDENTIIRHLYVD
ncbi:1276_t:CDS:2 [Paraglomus brasilianum]|uniref:1276_t:CDS:1 n=1 Tax=Paraglomus brasilianum TaxID=144538 RepID=A0A9N9B7F1_9GLOM|nr:1276_t:CDS:2 [Paraglomus brasilianum]